MPAVFLLLLLFLLWFKKQTILETIKNKQGMWKDYDFSPF